jgi:hypothetical protein
MWAFRSGIGITLIGLGVAGVATGVVLLMGSSDTDDNTSTRVALGPGNLSVSGTF